MWLVLFAHQLGHTVGDGLSASTFGNVSISMRDITSLSVSSAPVTSLSMATRG